MSEPRGRAFLTGPAGLEVTRVAQHYERTIREFAVARAKTRSAPNEDIHVTVEDVTFAVREAVPVPVPRKAWFRVVKSLMAIGGGSLLGAGVPLYANLFVSASTQTVGSVAVAGILLAGGAVLALVATFLECLSVHATASDLLAIVAEASSAQIVRGVIPERARKVLNKSDGWVALDEADKQFNL